MRPKGAAGSVEHDDRAVEQGGEGDPGGIGHEQQGGGARRQAGHRRDWDRGRAVARNTRRRDGAVARERQLKGWTRAKKEALIHGEWDALTLLAKRRGGRPR